MNEYKSKLFDALVWTHAVEKIVRELISICADKKHLNLDAQELKIIEGKYPFGRLITILKPCIPEDVVEELRVVKEERNKLIHQVLARYIENEFLKAVIPDELEQEAKEDIKFFEEITFKSGNVYGKLLDLHTKLSA